MPDPIEDAADKLLLLTAALFAVRLFRAAGSYHPDERAVREAADREGAAERAALDAAAIIRASSKIKL